MNLREKYRTQLRAVVRPKAETRSADQGGEVGTLNQYNAMLNVLGQDIDL